MPCKSDKHARVVLDLVTGADPRARSLMPGWDIELARQKTLFLTTPSEFPEEFDAVAKTLDAEFAKGTAELRQRAVSYVLGIAESLHSPVELDHNLKNKALHGGAVLDEEQVKSLRAAAALLLTKWADKDGKAFLAVTSRIRADDLAANGGDNLFAAWARRWGKRNARDPYAAVDDYLACFGALCQQGMYYPDLYFARERGKTRTQFLTECCEQASRARRMGCLGALCHAELVEARALEAMLAFRSIYLLRGLGHVLLPSDLDSGDRVRLLDDILLDCASEIYRKTAARRVGVPNSLFATSPALFTMSVVAQHSVISNAVRNLLLPAPPENQISRPARNDVNNAGSDAGRDGSVAAFPLGPLSDKIREHRVKFLVDALPDKSKFKHMDPASVANLRDVATNNIEFILQLKDEGIEFKPGDEEDAIDHAGALVVKRVVKPSEKPRGKREAPVLVSAKLNFLPNIELLGVEFSADSAAVQASYLRLPPFEIDNWQSLYEHIDSDGNPIPGSVWARRADILSSIWPEWKGVYEA